MNQELREALRDISRNDPNWRNVVQTLRNLAESERSENVKGEHICPACRVGRDEYEGEPNKYLPTCPNCGSRARPTREEGEGG